MRTLFDKPDTFTEFDRANPAVWKLFEKFALQAAAAGRRRFGARMIWERMRWYYSIETAEDFKLNNNLAPRYARKFLALHPEHPELFATREHE